MPTTSDESMFFFDRFVAPRDDATLLSVRVFVFFPIADRRSRFRCSRDIDDVFFVCGAFDDVAIVVARCYHRYLPPRWKLWIRLCLFFSSIYKPVFLSFVRRRLVDFIDTLFTSFFFAVACDRGIAFSRLVCRIFASTFLFSTSSSRFFSLSFFRLSQKI